MKKYINVSLVVLTFTMLTFSSCKKSFFSDVNVNTNAPEASSIVPGVMLSTVEGALAYTIGGDFSRFSSIITQQTLGFSRQAQGYNGYTFTSVDFDNVWGNLYTSVMENNKVLMEVSDAKQSNAYSGISRILMAYSLQVAVDTWGALPYSEAFRGDKGQLQSKYDSDKALYDTILVLLNTAITQLNNTSQDIYSPGAEDVIYGGNTSKWIKFAHAIKARIYIHQSKGNVTMANSALAELAQSFTSNADNAQYTFGSTETSANPWYQFNQQRADIAFAESTLGMELLANNDPRLSVYIDTAYNDVNGVGMGDYYGDIDAPVEFISYDEVLFMKAEATLIATGNIATAQDFYQAGIRANMEKLNILSADINSYITANGTLPATVSTAIAKVSEEEFIALYLNPEAWALWRRNNSPNLTPAAGTGVPRRLLYPQTEYSYNGANVPGSVTLLAPKIFWDK
ncbi:SusD/RagB family nutrient-binding outer membrane lipoprotein [Flavitalea antarctica]